MTFTVTLVQFTTSLGLVHRLGMPADHTASACPQTSRQSVRPWSSCDSVMLTVQPSAWERGIITSVPCFANFDSSRTITSVH
jgi:hypothetical protein